MHATEKLEQEITITMPVKFLSAIVRSLVDAAELHQIHLEQVEMDMKETMTSVACIKCYGEVYEVMREAMGRALSDDDIDVLRKVADATVIQATEEGVMN
jgi:hypothetical protein